MPNAQRGRRSDQCKIIAGVAPDKLYAAFRDGKSLMAWLPPGDMSGEAIEYDFAVGGSYRIALQYNDRTSAKGKSGADKDISFGTFLELVPNRLIKQKVHFDSDDPELARGMIMIWEFRSMEDGTEITVTAEEVPEAISKEDHLLGMSGSVRNLVQFAQAQGKKA